MPYAGPSQCSSIGVHTLNLKTLLEYYYKIKQHIRLGELGATFMLQVWQWLALFLHKNVYDIVVLSFFNSLEVINDDFNLERFKQQLAS